MKQLIWILLLTMSLLKSLQNYAQEPTEALRIGDRCPDWVLKNVKNAASDTLAISSLRGKLILLDFGTTTCPPCMQLLPWLDSTQQALHHKLQILMVTPESTERVQQFLSTHPLGRSISIPIVAADTLLKTVFPHLSIPHEVWIDGNGIVKAITGHEYMTNENIHTMLKGKNVHWPVKSDIIFDFENNLLTINEGIARGRKPANLYYSTLTNRMADMIRRGNKTKHQNYVKTTLINYSALELYLRTWKLFDPPYPSNRVVIKNIKKEQFIWDEKKELKAAWSEKNTYCYESVLPAGTTENQILRKLRADLDQYLNVNSCFRKIMMDCWIIRSLPGKESSFAKSNLDKPKGVKSLPITLHGLIFQLNRTYGYPPMIDETGKQTDMSIYVSDGSIYKEVNFLLLREQLMANGLTVEKGKRKIEMMIIDGNITK
jgi:thiol-disulfide isomerase/thioredoxin